MCLFDLHHPTSPSFLETSDSNGATSVVYAVVSTRVCNVVPDTVVSVHSDTPPRGVLGVLEVMFSLHRGESTGLAKLVPNAKVYSPGQWAVGTPVGGGGHIRDSSCLHVGTGKLDNVPTSSVSYFSALLLLSTAADDFSYLLDTFDRFSAFGNVDFNRFT